MFLVFLYRLHVPSIMPYLTENYMNYCRDPDKILRECKNALHPDLLVQLKLVLHYYNPTRSIVHITVEYRM